MDIKNEMANTVHRRKRKHLIKRLSKAAMWASELAAFSAEKCDARSALEAEAYSSWMQGNVLFEKETDWSRAMGLYVKAKCVPAPMVLASLMLQVLLSLTLLCVHAWQACTSVRMQGTLKAQHVPHILSVQPVELHSICVVNLLPSSLYKHPYVTASANATATAMSAYGPTISISTAIHLAGRELGGQNAPD